jgi:DUF2075 family protein
LLSFKCSYNCRSPSSNFRGPWSKPWNLRGDRGIGGAPPAALWASDPAGVGQVGCIYTAQGFEYDYAGVILGDDLVWRDGAFVAQREASRDRGVVAAENFDELVRNVHKVLLTRGLIGCAVSSTDQATNEMLRSLIKSTVSASLAA